jgi:hypothetical protein
VNNANDSAGVDEHHRRYAPQLEEFDFLTKEPHERMRGVGQADEGHLPIFSKLSE